MDRPTTIKHIKAQKIMKGRSTALGRRLIDTKNSLLNKDKLKDRSGSLNYEKPKAKSPKPS